jgi:hypothetical protein
MYSAEEKETVCVYDYIEDLWDVYTCVQRHMTKLRKIAEPYWEEKVGDRVTAAKWKLKGNQLRFAASVVMTEEQKKAARERGRRLHKHRG